MQEPKAVTWAQEYSDYVLKLQQNPRIVWLTQLQSEYVELMAGSL